MSHILAERVAAGELDFALAFNIDPQNGITRTPLLREPMFFIAGPKSEFATPGPIDLAELAKAVIVIPTDKGQVIHLVKAAMDQHSLPLNIAFQIESMDAIKGLIRQGAACAVLPYGTVVHEAEAGTLLARKIINPPLMRTLYVLQPTGHKPSALHDATLAIIEKFVTPLADTAAFERVNPVAPETATAKGSVG
jgi:LysR family nitrogen assimilation transcriptional regulator